MPRYVIQACTRFIVEHADTPERALEWFNNSSDIDLDVSPVSYGHLQVVGTISDDVALGELEPGTYAAWRAANVVPLAGQWSAEPWPPRACPMRSEPRDLGPMGPNPVSERQARELVPATTGKGGYHPISRLTGLLYDIKLEALAAKQSDSARRRNNAFDEIADLAQSCADFVEKHARPAIAGPRRKASHAA